jgi:hypothetical protein
LKVIPSGPEIDLPRQYSARDQPVQHRQDLFLVSHQDEAQMVRSKMSDMNQHILSVRSFDRLLLLT